MPKVMRLEGVEPGPYPGRMAPLHRYAGEIRPRVDKEVCRERRERAQEQMPGQQPYQGAASGERSRSASEAAPQLVLRTCSGESMNERVGDG